ncbi:hypothetical protein HNQ80_002213 [Anaerosolibacter carboniphilus]|uniref:VCBS repeat-containing protein n=1 Tax=Anaerosolibacter carboniphilus TaxID=1417629 RepID=A0A841KQU7_9FIRM|nr:hypothetical protein [Anaerosolibacter carboniphilus]
MYNWYRDLNPMNAKVVYSVWGDVNGDGVPDYVYLTGVKTPDSPFIQKITLMIQDGRTGMTHHVPLKSDAGYNPTLFLGDFTGDGVKDIMVGINSGGSGGMMYYYIYSDIRNMPRLLFDYEVFNETYKYDVTYKDNYKVEVVNTTERTRYLIDISDREKDYLNEIYQANGKLKAPIQGFVNPLGGLYPIDFDSDGIYDLFAFQRIAGRYNADSLGYVQTTLKWNKRQFNLSDQYVAIFGAKK